MTFKYDSCTYSTNLAILFDPVILLSLKLLGVFKRLFLPIVPVCTCSLPLSLLHILLMKGTVVDDIFIELFTRENNDSRVSVLNK